MKTSQALINHARDFFRSGGSPARALLRGGFNTNALRTNDVLRKDEWELLDQTLVGIARQRLIGVTDLREAGLVVPLGGLGILFSEYEKLGDMSAADVDYAAVTDGEKDSVTFDLAAVPVPIIHKSFQINARRMQASVGVSGIGQPIDVTTAAVAAEKVAEQAEELLFNGSSTLGTLGGNSLYGYTNEPNVNTGSGSDWGTIGNIETSIIGTINAIEADNYFGNDKVLYVAPTQYGQLRAFHTDGSGQSAKQRALAIEGVRDIRPGDRLSDGTGVMVSMRKSVVDLALGQDLTVIEWEEKGGLQFEFKVLTAMAARVKSDAQGGSGIATVSSI